MYKRVWLIPLILIPLISAFFTLIFGIDITILQKTNITFGQYETTFYYFELWNREGNGYINNLQLTLDAAIGEFKTIFTDIPTINGTTLNIEEILLTILNVIIALINVLIIKPLKMLAQVLNIYLAILGFNFTQTETFGLYNWLKFLGEINIPYFSL